jgi:hypothetical protein
MPAKVFIPQEAIDSWLLGDRVDVEGETLRLREHDVTVRLVPGYFFSKLQAGDDAQGLLGRVKAKAAVLALGAEVYMSSVILGETAYEVEMGFVGKAVGASGDEALLAAMAALGE